MAAAATAASAALSKKVSPVNSPETKASTNLNRGHRTHASPPTRSKTPGGAGALFLSGRNTNIRVSFYNIGIQGRGSRRHGIAYTYTDPATTYHETHSHRHSHAAHSPIRVARWTNTRPLTDGLNDPEPPDKPLQPQYHTKHGGGCLAYVWLCRTPYMSSVSKHPSQTPTQHSEEWHVLRLPAAILAEALLRVLS